MITIEPDPIDGNNPPSIVADGDVTVDEGNLAQNSGTVSDPNGDTVSLSASAGNVTNNGGTWSWSLATSDGPAESRTVTITADDGNGGTAQTTFQLIVNNVAPSVNTITVPVEPVSVIDQSAYTVDVSFSDLAGVNDKPYQCDLNLNDDGVTFGEDVTQSEVAGTSCSASLNYAEPGVYTVRAKVTDKDGGTGSATAADLIVIYDPDGGFVTGGGWIMSPEGACQFDACTDLTTGKATFGFVSKYKKGADTPTGQTEFQFKAGNLNFHSGSYEWLVVAGPNAKYKGVGTINGAGNYGFMLTATDSDVNGGGDVDGFRIKIWDAQAADDDVVYDNKMDSGDDSYDTTALGGGNIKVHKGK